MKHTWLLLLLCHAGIASAQIEITKADVQYESQYARIICSVLVTQVQHEINITVNVPELDQVGDAVSFDLKSFSSHFQDRAYFSAGDQIWKKGRISGTAKNAMFNIYAIDVQPGEKLGFDLHINYKSSRCITVLINATSTLSDNDPYYGVPNTGFLSQQEWPTIRREAPEEFCIVPILEIGNLSKDYGKVAKDAKPSPYEATIKNIGTARLSGTISSNSSWITFSTSSYLIEPNGFVVVSISADPSSLLPGEHSGTIHVSSNGGEASGQVDISIQTEKQIWKNLVSIQDLSIENHQVYDLSGTNYSDEYKVVAKIHNNFGSDLNKVIIGINSNSGHAINKKIQESFDLNSDQVIDRLPPGSNSVIIGNLAPLTREQMNANGVAINIFITSIENESLASNDEIAISKQFEIYHAVGVEGQHFKMSQHSFPFENISLSFLEFEEKIGSMPSSMNLLVKSNILLLVYHLSEWNFCYGFSKTAIEMFNSSKFRISNQSSRTVDSGSEAVWRRIAFNQFTQALDQPYFGYSTDWLTPKEFYSDLISGFQNNATPIIGMATSSFREDRHAVVPISMIRDGDEVTVTVYNANQKNNASKIKFIHSDSKIRYGTSYENFVLIKPVSKEYSEDALYQTFLAFLNLFSSDLLKNGETAISINQTSKNNIDVSYFLDHNISPTQFARVPINIDTTLVLDANSAQVNVFSPTSDGNFISYGLSIDAAISPLAKRFVKLSDSFPPRILIDFNSDGKIDSIVNAVAVGNSPTFLENGAAKKLKRPMIKISGGMVEVSYLNMELPKEIKLINISGKIIHGEKSVLVQNYFHMNPGVYILVERYRSVERSRLLIVR